MTAVELRAAVDVDERERDPRRLANDEGTTTAHRECRCSFAGGARLVCFS